MKKYKWPFILLNLAILLILFNWSVVKKENTLKSGRLVLLELAPVDPRSLMQGDYMRLRYAMARIEVTRKSGYFVVTLDQHHVAKLVREQSAQKPLGAGEVLIAYKAPDIYDIHLGAESYFFEEGKAQKFDSAKFGGLRITEDGNSILTGLYDARFKLIEP